MVNKINFKNENKTKIEVLIEPAAEYFELDKGESISIEFEQVSEQFQDSLSIDLQDGLLVIYELRQCVMRVYKENELVYCTSY